MMLRSRAARAIVTGGAIAGFLDGVDAVLFYWLYDGVSPARLLQHIASGLLGRSAFNGGLYTVVLGITLQFVIATGAAAVYYAASLDVPALVAKPLLYGPAFGIAVYVVMRDVVVPLSAAYPKRLGPIPVPELADQLFSHLFFVGLPIALSARRAWRAKYEPERRTLEAV